MKPRFYSQILLLCTVLLFVNLVDAQSQHSSPIPPTPTTPIETDVLVVGGGTSGITAGIQAARMGARTLIVEETPWLGGMLTAACVSAIDGNNRLPSGLWGEFRQKIREHYSSANITNLATGWVSNTLFEPHVGDSIWKAMARNEEKFLTVRHGLRPIAVQKRGNTVTGVTFVSLDGTQTLQVTAKITVDATELGDVSALAGAAFDVGMESRAISGESIAPAKANGIIQDLTYAAVLKDYGNGADRRIAKPIGYNPDDFNCCCKEACLQPSNGQTNGKTLENMASLVDAQKMLDYAKLPSTSGAAKYMLNWPRHGNDYYLNAIPLSYEGRLKEYERAKQHTLGFVYHIQTALGFKHVGLADDEFPTKDSLAFIPYHRESRRTQGVVRMNVNHILKPYNTALYKTAIAVGDYPIDHHHAKNSQAPAIAFPAVPSFSVPLGCLIPKKMDGIISAEKNISVSNVVNGTTRLQPCVMLIGQAAGALAAVSVREGKPARNVSVRSVQQTLLNARCWLLPFLDVSPESKYFQAVQRISLTGALKGTGVPNQWANQTWFYPDSTVTLAELQEAMAIASRGTTKLTITVKKNVAKRPATIAEAISAVWLLKGAPPMNGLMRFHGNIPINAAWLPAYNYLITTNTHVVWADGDMFDADRAITRQELAQLMHNVFHPFDRSVGLEGKE